MSRPKKATVDYFPHYVDHGKTMFTIESKYGNNGYSFWFKLLEILGKTEHHFLDCNDIETWEFLLAKTRFSEIDATEILNLCSRLNAIDPDLWKMKIVRSENFIDNLNTVYQRRKIDVMDIPEIRDYCLHKYPVNGVSVDINPQSKVKESKEEESKEKNSKINSIELNFQFSSYEFMEVWNVLIKQPKWKKKTVHALQASLNMLSKYSEEDCIEIMNKSIAGGYQGLFELKKQYIKPEEESTLKHNLRRMAETEAELIAKYGTGNE